MGLWGISRHPQLRFRAGGVYFGDAKWDAVQRLHPGQDHPKELRWVLLNAGLKLSLAGTRGIS